MHKQDDHLIRVVLEHSVDGLLIIDNDGVVRLANPAARSMFAGKTQDLIGFQLGAPAIQEPVEIILPDRDGARHYVELRAAEIEWDGQPASLASLRDVSQRKRTEEELQKQTDELRARNYEMIRFNRAAVGRELVMIDLKREINELCRQLGQPPRYGIAGEDAPESDPA
jgi:PAS domain-containing protein